MLKTTEIFPLDIDVDKEEQVGGKKDKFLRPEFLCSYERPLKADAGKDLGILVSKDTKYKPDEVRIMVC